MDTFYGAYTDIVQDLTEDDKGISYSSTPKEKLNLFFPQGQMLEGMAQVRAAIGPDLAVTDQEIRDALWHYYYDVSKSVSWILGMSRLLVEI
jgi:hypothetical protein